jgi:divalent metal cation (Fe/Co/Zn/Cd) transporter
MRPSTRRDAVLTSRARLAESLTVGWMVIELVVALWAGIAARSVALTSFGIDSALELFTALVVVCGLPVPIPRAACTGV